ncbi:MAG: hypothetical protein ABI772_15315, partial [Bacteroidota bacterium]
MKKILLPLLLIILVNSCERNDDETGITSSQQQGTVLQQRSVITPVPVGAPLDHHAIDGAINKSMSMYKTFNWMDAGLKMMWSALQYHESVVAIGYQPAGATDVDRNIHQINIKAGEWKEVHDALID